MTSAPGGAVDVRADGGDGFALDEHVAHEVVGGGDDAAVLDDQGHDNSLAATIFF